MNISIPKLVRAIELSDYAPELAGVRVRVWVNPPLELVRDYNAGCELTADPATRAEGWQKIFGAYARLWSAGEDPATQWSADDVRALKVSETDPRLYGWLLEKTWALVRAYREGEEKK